MGEVGVEEEEPVLVIGGWLDQVEATLVYSVEIWEAGIGWGR